jgi:glutamate synthase (NADPH/NADH)
MHAREGLMKSIEFGDYLNQICPAIEKDQSDSGSIDNVIEFLVQCGHRSLPEYYITYFWLKLFFNS